MPHDKKNKQHPTNQDACVVSTKSRVREPGEKQNGTLTSSGYEMEILKARERALDAQKLAEEATRQAGAGQGQKIIQTVRYKKGVPQEIVYLSLAVEEASAEIQESVRQARLCMLEALETASLEFSRMLDQEIQQSLKRAREELARTAEEFIKQERKGKDD